MSWAFVGGFTLGVAVSISLHSIFKTIGLICLAHDGGVES